MRGIDFVQVPTTLLSQSDSSVGGKTGIDFMESKNILGAFHQPKLVYINVATLKSLPNEQFVSGMGEVIKHGIIRDSEFFDYIEKNSDKIKTLDNETLIKMDKINCSIKADVVEQDEKENGLRAILNFGHTIGHAVESAYAAANPAISPTTPPPSATIILFLSISCSIHAPHMPSIVSIPLFSSPAVNAYIFES